MHDIEPHFKWRQYYTAEGDSQSPFYQRTYSEFYFENKVYNYYIHPQWDDFGSNTLYIKLLYADYDQGFVFIECIGEWNDLIENDVMIFKREVIDPLVQEGIHKFILIGENTMNVHCEEVDYYEEWYNDIIDEDGWITFINIHQHVYQEFVDANISQYVYMGEILNNIEWRRHKPQDVFNAIDGLIETSIKQLTY